MSIATETDSKAEQLLQSLGWDYRPSGVDQSVVQLCPICSNNNGKFYINTSGEDKDGLWGCKVCGKEGNLYQLKEKLGIRTQNITSTKDIANSQEAIKPLIDYRLAHKRLMDEEAFADVLEYLLIERGLSMSVIEEFKLGAESKDGKLYVVIPYIGPDGKTCLYTKHRNIAPTSKKDKFWSSPGREVPLFNENILVTGLDEIVCVEGEADALALISLGYKNVVGVPGANTKKAIWIDKLDKVNNIYLLYDRDEVGQKAAKDMATRIGIEKVKNIVLPTFQKKNGETGKDINELILTGFTLEQFLSLKKSANPFDVEGIYNLSSVLEELHLDLTEHGAEPTLKTPWPSLTKTLGGLEWGDVIGVLADAKIGKSTTCLNWLQYYVEQGYNCLNFCQEMLPKRVVRKWVSMITKTDDTPGKSQITSEVVDYAFDIAKTFSGEMLFGYTKGANSKEIFQTIRQAVRRYGVKIVCFDNLHLMARSIEHRTQELSKLSKEFKDIAMELNIVILLILQPTKISQGNLVEAHNASGTGDISKDVDGMVVLNRRRVLSLKESDLGSVIETDGTFDPYLYANVGLCRYGSGGYCTLYFDGAISTVRELGDVEFATFAENRIKGVIQEELIQV